MSKNYSINKEFEINNDGILENVLTDSKEVYIPEGVKCIAKKAFKNCNAHKVYIPDTVTHIESGAFKESVIEFIRLSANMCEITEDTFADCIKLKMVNNADGICRIGKKAFYGCIKLEWIDGLENVKTIEEEAFYDCSSLCIDVSMDVSRIGKHAFANCTSISLLSLDRIKFIGDYAFENSGIQIADMTETENCFMGEGVFANCKDLETVNMNESMSYIPQKAFYKCISLKEINVFEFVKYIGTKAFFECKSLKEFEGKNLSYIGENAFGNSGLEKLDLSGNSLSWISGSCFKDCKNLLFARLPDSVETVHCKAFYGCENLCAIYFPQKLRTIEGYAFYGCKNKLIDLFFGDEISRIKHKAFGNCTMLNEVYLHENTLLDDDTFSKDCGDRVRLIAVSWGRIKGYAETHADDVIFIDLMDEVMSND